MFLATRARGRLVFGMEEVAAPKSPSTRAQTSPIFWGSFSKNPPATRARSSGDFVQLLHKVYLSCYARARENPDRIEALIRDDVEVLAMWREEMKGKAGRPKQEGETRRNPTQFKTADRGRAYDLSRLQRESPELFAQVVAGTISANAAGVDKRA